MKNRARLLDKTSLPVVSTNARRPFCRSGLSVSAALFSAKVPALRPPVRVCFMIDELGLGGTETQLVALIRHLNPSLVEPSLCLLKGEDQVSQALEPNNCPVLRLEVRSLRCPGIFSKLLTLARFLRRQRVNVLQAYFVDSTYVGVPVARLVGVPYIVRVRNDLGYWVTPMHRRLNRLYRPFVDVTLTNSEVGRQALRADTGVSPRSVVVIENGVDLSRFASIPSLDGGRRHQSVGVVANLRPVKNLELFVRAAARVGAAHPDVRFQIAGEGELRPMLEQRIKEAGLQGRFALPGVVEEIPAFLSTLDVAVLCSDSEGMSNAVLEYMAAGRAIVVTAVGANTQLIEDGVHGLLVPPGDEIRLADALDRLLRDAVLAARLGAAARQRVREHYSREAMVRRFEAFYLGLVGRHADGR